MKWIVVAVAASVAALGIIAADPAMARAKHHAKARCVDGPKPFSWDFIWTLRPDPQPNGCSPAAYDVGRFVGQDPDRNIRHQLRRDPDAYYWPK